MRNLSVKATVVLFIMLMALSCSGPESDQPLLTAEHPLHLEEHIDEALIEGSEVPEDIPEPVEWRFDEPQLDWKPVKLKSAQSESIKPVQVEDALRLPLTTRNRVYDLSLFGVIYVDLPDWNLQEWAYVEIRARARDPMNQIVLAFNYTEEDPVVPQLPQLPFNNIGDIVPLVTDGTIQTYRLSVGERLWRKWEGPWTHLGIGFESQAGEDAGALDILSVRVIPKEHIYADAPFGVREVLLGNRYRRTLYTHAPGRLKYRLRVPEGGRLDAGLGVVRDDAPVSFRITVKPTGTSKETLFEETYADSKHWAQRSVDLSHLEGKKVVLVLEAESDRAGTVAFWSAPTLSSVRKTEMPNVIFYIIDAAGADFMSVYGYNRSTTPNLERLALEGAVFEHAYSNSTWTKPSNASFMTSLHHSVLGGYKTDQDPVPEQAVTMAQHFHRAGFQTAVFTSNANSGSLSNFQRGVDVFRDMETQNQSVSSVNLHNDFWKWRENYAGEPYWVHFQTTDVHQPYTPIPPFSGLFVSPELQDNVKEWMKQIQQVEISSHTSIADIYTKQLEKFGINRLAFFDIIRGLYNETMAHQDYQLGRLIERLKAKDEWERTLLIIASDHGHPAASYPRFGRGLMDPPVPEWEGAILGSFKTRIPMMFIWSGHIAGGQRLTQQVSMIDMLPTILDLVGLPMTEVMQGQSLAPLLLGKKGWEQHPVILDEFYVDLKTEELIGNIEVIDGRWGASLEIAPMPKEGDTLPRRRYQAPATGRYRFPPHEFPDIPRLLLYDLWNDPYALHNINKERPDLVEKYTKFLKEQWIEHRALAKRFTRPSELPLTPEQLSTLRSLGYIR